MNILTWAVVPSNGRPFLQECITSLMSQVDGIVIVENGTGDTTVRTPFPEKIHRVRDIGSDMNISRWWNRGMDEVALKVSQGGLPEEPWNVLVVNDDVVAPPNLVETLSTHMRACTAVLAFPNQHDDYGTLWTRAEPVNLFHRITGYCYMVRGETGLMLDESLVWWAGDDDLDWRARTRGGSLLVPGCPVEHKAPNGTFLDHPELHEQASRDMQYFEQKWHRRPW